jgi:beta-fructofuranosidase
MSTIPIRPPSFAATRARPRTEEQAPPTGEGYAPADRYLWDSWILQDGDTYHLYHLDAPRNETAADGSVQATPPDDRHHRAQIRHAISTDLRHWQDRGPTLGSGPAGTWDAGPVWTGNTCKTADGYFMFYTGRRDCVDQTQRIGLARSSDGHRWSRSDRPILEPDPRWYETDEPNGPVYKAWRDPEVVRDPESGRWLMYFAAKTKEGDPRHKGCIGLAISERLEGPYQALPPVLAPGLYGEMEVPQVVRRDGKVYLFFSTFAKNYRDDHATRVGGAQSGLHCYVGPSLEGPFEPLNGTAIVAGTESNLYTLKLLPDPARAGEFVAMGWHVEDRTSLAREAFHTSARSATCALPCGPAAVAAPWVEKAFTLSPPIPVEWRGDNIRLLDPRRRPGGISGQFPGSDVH